jgi:hypothetical protein
MKKPPLDQDIADLAPADSALTAYDEEHLVTYLPMLDADEGGADWRDVSRIVLHIDPERDPNRARRSFESHLSRARWMTQRGYRHLLRGPPRASSEACSSRLASLPTLSGNGLITAPHTSASRGRELRARPEHPINGHSFGDQLA